MNKMHTRLAKLERLTSQRVSHLLEARRKATESDTRLEAAWQIMQSTGGRRMVEDAVRPA